MPPIKPEAQTDDANRSYCGCGRQKNASKPSRSAGCRSFSRLFQSELANRFRQFGISDTISVEIDQEDGDPVLSGGFSQVMQIVTPLSRVRKILGHSFGQQDMARISPIHHSPGKIDSSACNVYSVIYVANFINWPAVNTHPKLQLRILFQLFADLNRTPHRRFGTVKKYECHSIARGKSN
ncbi:MAG: hypothetical protein Udaeo_11230 [Candidatus Udaeobacter sp.]|nr:MAG: hypothetical protein Udaeo_11230 [Candidatus Udaeobacter sp.]